MRTIDADALIPLIQEDKIEGKTLEIVKTLGDGLQVETLNQACDRHIKIINSLPTIEAEPLKNFAEWVASEVCNKDFEDMWSLGAFAEVTCRKLYALGIVQKFRDEWVYIDKDELDGEENG